MRLHIIIWNILVVWSGLWHYQFPTKYQCHSGFLLQCKHDYATLLNDSWAIGSLHTKVQFLSFPPKSLLLLQPKPLTFLRTTIVYFFMLLCFFLLCSIILECPSQSVQFGGHFLKPCDSYIFSRLGSDGTICGKPSMNLIRYHSFMFLPYNILNSSYHIFISGIISDAKECSSE